MYNKIFAIICSIVLIACSQSGANKIEIKIADDKIKLIDKNKHLENLQLKIGEQINYTYSAMTDDEFSILEVLKSNKSFYYDIALLFAQNNSEVTFNLKVSEVVDTTFTYHWDVEDVLTSSTNVIQGKCAKLIDVYDAVNVEEDIIRWLFRNNYKNIGSETINKMRLYLQELNRTDYKEYVTKEEIPVLKSFQSINYKISSDFVADNYYLFACRSEKEIEEFVEEMVSLKFKGAVRSLKQSLGCYRSPSTSGTVCVFLIGINNDWSYKISPVGLVCIDDVKPIILSENDSSENIFSEEDIVLGKNKIKVKMPKELPIFRGWAFLDTRNWSGNNISCNVNFVVYFGGDVKNISLIRDGNLAKWLGKGKKVIDLQAGIGYPDTFSSIVEGLEGQESVSLPEVAGTSIFTYELHLEEGDNYVPIILTDLRGNETKYKFNVRCKSESNDNSQINIENSVNVY